MGRYVRTVLRTFAASPEIALTLLVRAPRDAAAYRAVIGENVAIAPLRAARNECAYDRVWYPWNGIRFASAAPALVTINDDFAFAYPARGFIARRREQGPIRTAVRDAAHIATISRWSRDELVRRFALAPERVSVVPLSPDPYFSPGVETSPFDEPFVLAVGAGEPRKNIAFLADAFELAFPRAGVRLAIVGQPYAALGARLAAAGPRMTILTHVDDAALRRLYRTAGAVAVPSLAEGFGLVAAEAQACGAAVIAADAAALPEAVGDAGLLLGARDLTAWSAALRELIERPERSAVYRARAAERWNAGSAQGTADAFRALLERPVDDLG